MSDMGVTYIRSPFPAPKENIYDNIFCCFTRDMLLNQPEKEI